MIDIPIPPSFDVPSPWRSQADQPVVTYVFKTSWDGIAWTNEQKYIVRDAIDQLDSVLPRQTFVETGDFSLRWAGSDFFRLWPAENGHSELDLSTGLGAAYKHDGNRFPEAQYPNNEIYFNATKTWSFRIEGPRQNEVDFWTVALHEIIHMLASDAHASDPEEVMHEDLSAGQRKFLRLSDLQILVNAGYDVDLNPALIRTGPLAISEPATWWLALSGFGLFLLRRDFLRRRTQR